MHREILKDKHVHLYSNDSYLTMAVGEPVLLNRISHINKYGLSGEIGTATTPEDVWSAGGLWVPPTQPRRHNIISSSDEDIGTLLSSGTVDSGNLTVLRDDSATFVSDGVTPGDTVVNDTNLEHSTIVEVKQTVLRLHKARHDSGFNTGESYRVVTAASTGASVIHLFMLDKYMKFKEEFVIANGTTGVLTADDSWRIWRMHVDGAANRESTNVGNISAVAEVDGTITAFISAGKGQTLMTHFSVPRGKTGYMTGFYSGIVKTLATAGAIANVSINEVPFASIDGAGIRQTHFFGLSLQGTSYQYHPFKPYKEYLEQTDIFFRVEEVSSNNTIIFGGYDMILVDKKSHLL